MESIFEDTADACLEFYREWRKIQKSDNWIQLGFLCGKIEFNECGMMYSILIWPLLSLLRA